MPHPLAGKPAPRDVLVDVETPQNLYHEGTPAPADPQQRVAFGTSGHRGSSLKRAFNEAHILAVTQAVCEYRKAQGTSGPLYLGKDTHALSDPAQETALEVLAANDLHVLWSRRATPTPVISRARVACGSPPIRSAGPTSITGTRSRPSTGSTSRW